MNRWSFLVIVVPVLMSSDAIAQVAPDTSLNTTVRTSDRLNFTIEEGRQAGGNLFHSFRDFSVPTGGSVSFSNATSVQNIIGRVTGGNASTIDGLIRANGSANLFLINPSGIIFGANASLNIGGSFVASTADRIRFADGTEMSTIDSQPPLLTISAPIGLQYSSNSGAIQVLGTGSNLTFDSDRFAVIRDNRAVGLDVQSGRTLALIGREVTLQGGNLTAPSGQVEVGSVSNGWVTLVPNHLGWTIDYTGLSNFGNVELREAASIDVSGERSGNIQIQGRNIRLLEGSGILAITEGATAGGTIQLSASQAIDISGTSADESFRSGLFSDVAESATGKGGSVTIAAERLSMRDAAILSVSTLGVGDAGNLLIRVADLDVSGGSGLYADVNQSASGNGGTFTIAAKQIRLSDSAEVSATTVGTGNGGHLRVEAERLTLRTGGLLIGAVLGIGNGGSMSIEAGEIEVTGETEDGMSGSSISSQVFRNAEGNGGSITINANRISVTDGAFISTSTFGNGRSGDLTIRAADIQLAGISPTNTRFASGLFSSVQRGAVGAGGTLTIVADRLQILRGAAISTATRGIGNSGALRINAKQIEVMGTDASGQRTSSLATAVGAEGVGSGGNLTITTDRLEISQGGEITTLTQGQGNAGDLSIQANAAIALAGRSSNGRFESRLTASSQSNGAAGTLRISTPRLSLQDHAVISVSSESTGSAGDLGTGQKL